MSAKIIDIQGKILNRELDELGKLHIDDLKSRGFRFDEKGHVECINKDLLKK